MGVLCGCKGGCACAVESGGEIAVSGSGTESRPYDLEFSGVTITGVGNDSVTVTVTGSDPAQISAETTGASSTTTAIESSGEWVKPVGGSVARIVVVGGGGGGATQPSGPGAFFEYGGLGGAGGACSSMIVPLALLPDTVPVIVGAGGAGGFGSGELGSDGGFSSFGSYLYAPGGSGGPYNGSGVYPSARAEGGRGGTPPWGGPGAPGSWLLTPGVGQIGNSTFGGGAAGGQVGESANVLGVSVPAGLMQPNFFTSWPGGGGGDTVLASRENLVGRFYGGGGGGAGILVDGVESGGDGGPGVVAVTIW